MKDKTDEHDGSLHRQSGWPSGLRLQTCQSDLSGVAGSNPGRTSIEISQFFFIIGDKNSLSQFPSHTMAENQFRKLLFPA